jgi:hypothetical protein
MPVLAPCDVEPVEIFLDLGQRHSEGKGRLNSLGALEERLRVLKEQFGD